MDLNKALRKAIATGEGQGRKTTKVAFAEAKEEHRRRWGRANLLLARAH